jgi:hypothetical protein
VITILLANSMASFVRLNGLFFSLPTALGASVLGVDAFAVLGPPGRRPCFYVLRLLPPRSGCEAGAIICVQLLSQQHDRGEAADHVRDVPRLFDFTRRSALRVEGVGVPAMHAYDYCARVIMRTNEEPRKAATSQVLARCGARTRRRQPRRMADAELGKRRCKFHGGLVNFSPV